VFFKRWGAWAIVIGRFLGPLRASVPIVAGITEMPQVRFQIANWTSASSGRPCCWRRASLESGGW
jgi:membrane protein DedA with SNARE-associated domain